MWIVRRAYTCVIQRDCLVERDGKARDLAQCLPPGGLERMDGLVQELLNVAHLLRSLDNSFIKRVLVEEQTVPLENDGQALVPAEDVLTV